MTQPSFPNEAVEIATIAVNQPTLTPDDIRFIVDTCHTLEVGELKATVQFLAAFINGIKDLAPLMCQSILRKVAALTYQERNPDESR